MSKKSNNLYILIECAVLIAVGTILAQIKIFRMPSGGSITMLSMLPFILISFRHGTKWGILSGLVNSLLQMALGGIYTPPAGTIWALIGSILLDYVLAYIVLGLASFFGKYFFKAEIGALFGTAIVCALRFFCVFLSGVVIWGSLIDGVWAAIVYSFLYNISYLLPDSILTIVAMYILRKKAPVLFTKKMIK